MDSHGRRPTTLSAFDVGCRWLTYAVRSEAEMRAHLEGLGFSVRAVSQALHRLTELGYLNDVTLACERALLLASRGYGDEWIERDLERRGIAAGAITGARSELDPETERARQWIRRRSSGRPPQAMWRVLVQRGFSRDTAEAVLDAAGPTNDDSAA